MKNTKYKVGDMVLIISERNGKEYPITRVWSDEKTGKIYYMLYRGNDLSGKSTYEEDELITRQEEIDAKNERFIRRAHD